MRSIIIRLGWHHPATSFRTLGLAIPMLFAGVVTALAADTPPSAQQAVPSREDLRPLSATSMDIADGRELAQRFCADCHGPAGIATIPGVPNLAGQRAPYLLSEMRAFLSGARGNDTMNGAITYLTPRAMSNVAAYYGSLDPAQPAASAKAGAEVDALQAGKAAAAACAGCHGESGVTHMPGIPSLIGQEPKYLLGAMAAYKTGERKNDAMKAMIAPLPPPSLDNIALFYALQRPVRASTPVTGDALAGQGIAAPCAACHGTEGVSGNPASPSLAGQDAQYLAAALHQYKDGARNSSTMKALSAALDDRAMMNLAAYYAGLQPEQPSVRKPLSTAEWAERCDRCHGVNGNSTDPRIPALAGQSESYLNKVLNTYRAGTRRSPVMAVMTDGLSGNDIRNLAAYYARQQAHSVVYVPIPQQ